TVGREQDRPDRSDSGQGLDGVLADAREAEALERADRPCSERALGVRARNGTLEEEQANRSRLRGLRQPALVRRRMVDRLLPGAVAEQPLDRALVVLQTPERSANDGRRSPIDLDRHRRTLETGRASPRYDARQQEGLAVQ